MTQLIATRLVIATIDWPTISVPGTHAWALAAVGMATIVAIISLVAINRVIIKPFEIRDRRCYHRTGLKLTHFCAETPQSPLIPG